MHSRLHAFGNSYFSKLLIIFATGQCLQWGNAVTLPDGSPERTIAIKSSRSCRLLYCPYWSICVCVTYLLKSFICMMIPVRNNTTCQCFVYTETLWHRYWGWLLNNSAPVQVLGDLCFNYWAVDQRHLDMLNDITNRSNLFEINFALSTVHCRL